MMRQFHLTYRSIDVEGKHWFLLEVGNEDPYECFYTKTEAVKYSRKVAQAASGSLRIHKRNGQIQEERSYGIDPPTKG